MLNVNYNQLNIKIVSHKNEKITFHLSNRDTNFTEKIIQKNIDMKNLRYKITIDLIYNFNHVIRSKYIPKVFNSLNSKVKYILYVPEDIYVNLEDMEGHNLYRIKIELVEKIHLDFEVTHNSSDEVYINTIYGIINQNKIEEIYKTIFKKKIFSLSEKDNIKAVNSEMEFRELDHILESKDVKRFTFNNRNNTDIVDFMNNKYKFSKKMTDERIKRVLYSRNSKLFFEQKMINNDIDPINNNNPFLKNEWFMGPIYSYDKNYKKLI
jgi:hypothetical protein